MVAEPVSGVVRVLAPKGGYRVVRGPTVLPVPSRLDATRGEVRLTLDVPGAEEDDTAEVGEGEFVVHQDAPTDVVGARTRLRLVGGGLESCAPRWKATAAYRVVRRRLKLRKRRGRIVTDDRFSVTGGEGTEWRVTEFCEYTRIDVEEGTVLSVPKEDGPPGLREFLQPGDMMTFGCDARPRRCAVALVRASPDSQGAPHDLIFAAATGPVRERELRFCVTPPLGATACGRFGELVLDGERGWFVSCLARSGPGLYRFRWATVTGKRFGPVLPLDIGIAEPPAPDNPGSPASCGVPEGGR